MSGRRSGKAGSRRAGKGAKGAPRPTLPQHQFEAPYAQLLTLGYGDFPDVYDTVAETARQDNPEAAARKLLAMVQDESYYDYDQDEYPGGEGGDARGWTRLHALRVLGRLGASARIAIEPLLPLLNCEDDYLREDVPFFYAEMGAAAVEPLARTLRDRAADSYRRSGAGESLAEIGEKHPETRASIVPILEETLQAEREDSALTGFLIISLCDLGAKESMPIIERAFREDRVDETLVSLAEVQEHFGFAITADRPRWSFGPGEPRRVDPQNETLPDDDEEDFQVPYVAPEKVGRNEACPCGSGKKYKKCCLK